MFLRFFLVLAALLLSACATKPAAPQMPAMTPSGAITYFEGGCFYYSSCDTYEIVVRPDGAYKLTKQNQKPPPTVTEGKLRAGAFAEAEAALLGANFMALPERMNGSDRKIWEPDVYPCMPHAPGMRITRDTGDGQKREIYWDLGCRSAPMSALMDKMRAALDTNAK